MKKVLFMIAMAVSMTQMSAQTEGGKYFEPKSEFNDKPFVFSNRGETEAILKLNAAYNKMDGKACTEFFADSINISNEKGESMRGSKNTWLLARIAFYGMLSMVVLVGLMLYGAMLTGVLSVENSVFVKILLLLFLYLIFWISIFFFIYHY